MLKKIFTILFIIALSWGAGVLLYRHQLSKQAQTNVQENDVQIIASIYPLAFFAQQIAGDQAQIRQLNPSGIEAHDFEPSLQGLAMIKQADLVLVNGVGFEEWLEQFTNELTDSKLVRVSEKLAFLHHQEDEHEDESEDEHEAHDHGPIDPHIWLDPQLALQQVAIITEKLQEIDPEHASYYQERATALGNELQALDAAFRQGLQTCQQRTIITTHSAFAYLAERYELEQVGIQGLSPEEEPSPQKMAKVSQLAKELGINHIFFETTVSPKVAQSIANEIGATTLVLHPLEGLSLQEVEAGADYFSIQRQNLENLRSALNCE